MGDSSIGGFGAGEDDGREVPLAFIGDSLGLTSVNALVAPWGTQLVRDEKEANVSGVKTTVCSEGHVQVLWSDYIGFRV